MPKSFLDLINEAQSGTGVGAHIVFSDEQITNLLAQTFGVGGGESLFHQQLVTLDHAKIIGLPTTAQEIVSAPGENKILILLSGVFVPTGTEVGLWDSSYTGVSTDFPASNFYIAYGDDVEFASILYDFQLFRGGNKYAPIRPYGTTVDTAPDIGLVIPQQLDFSNITNTALKLLCYNTAGNFTGGSANNVLQVNVIYAIYNLATGEFE